MHSSGNLQSNLSGGYDHYDTGLISSGYSKTRRMSVTNAGQRGNILLDALPADLRAAMEPSLRPVVLTKEQFLFQEDDRLDFVYFPDSAVVSEFKMLDDGRMVEIAVTGREGAIGLSSVYSESHLAPNFTQVSQAGSARKISAQTFEKLLRSNEKLRDNLSRFVDQYIRQISQKAICNMYHSVKERLCTWLLMIQDRSHKEILNVTHEQIARSLGIYRPSATSIALELRRGGSIQYGRGAVAILDRQLLESDACTCYRRLSTAY